MTRRTPPTDRKAAAAARAATRAAARVAAGTGSAAAADPVAEPMREPTGPLRIARAALAWERLWPALWPAAGLAGLFVAAAWIGLVALLNPWAHLALLLAVLASVVWLLRRGLRGFAWPSVAEARRRIERDSRFEHRPLTILTDKPAGDGRDPVAAALWQAAQDRARRQVDRLTVTAPHPNMAGRDPWALRAAVGLLLVVGVGVSWGDLPGRLGQALRPDIALGGIVAPTLVEVWVTPPDYTGLPPIFLTREQAPLPLAGSADRPAAPVDTDGEPDADTPPFIPVPAGSTVLARVTGGYGTPELVANDTTLPFEAVAGGGWQASLDIAGGARIAITQAGREVRAWPIVVVPDQAPGIAFRQKPEETNRQALRLDYTAADDYGLTGVTATIRVGVELPEAVDSTPLTLPLPLPGRSPREANAGGFHDLTPHPWAGLPVLIRLEAVDAIGQTGQSGEEAFVLPERRFSHPVAQALIEQRKTLTMGGDRAREPVARTLSDLSVQPGSYGEKLSVFLALRASVNRLMTDGERGAITTVQQTLWDTALAIEDGGLSLAERDLRDAQQRLMEALDNNAPDAEIEQLMAELEQAMQQFLDALEEQARQAMQDGRMPPEMDLPTPDDMRTMTREDLERMLEQMRQMAETGSRDSAREMLSQLQEMMESLRTGQPPSPQQAEQAEQMMEMMQQLQELTQEQQALMDQTFQEAQRAEPGEAPPEGQGMEGAPMPGLQPGPQGPARQGGRPRQGTQQGQQQGGEGQDQGGSMPGALGDMAERQEVLRRQLGEIMRQLGESQGDIPRQLGRAERAMNEAGQALQQGRAGEAVPSQSDALDQLQQGLQSMAEQMAQQMMNQGMQAGARQPGRMPGRDPLGRPMNNNGPFNSENVEIPEEGEIQRAREILEELRRRAGQPDRPKLERDYIDRLLDRF
ncbi:MAG: hypothetical protein RLY86_3861 [Pseudomonadota bacterium]|jgi:uncharacterized protein (TIGR02302 family)